MTRPKLKTPRDVMLERLELARAAGTPASHRRLVLKEAADFIRSLPE